MSNEREAVKLTREQFEALNAWIDAKIACATYQPREGDRARRDYGDLSGSIQESETTSALVNLLVCAQEE